MSRRCKCKRVGGGLKLSPVIISEHVRFGASANEARDASWLDGVHVGDDQGVTSACTTFSGLKIEAMHFGNERDFTDAECLTVYRSICKWLGRGDAGMTFEEAFAGLKREGFFRWAKRIEQVFDFVAMQEGPLWYGLMVTPGFQDTDKNGCPNYALKVEDLGLHATVLAAAGRVERYQRRMLTVINSWGPRWGYKGMVMLDDEMHQQIGFAMYRLIPK